MNLKPIKPVHHQLIDYGLGALQAVAPEMLGINPKAVALYRVSSLAFLGVNCVTDGPYAVKRLLPMRVHKAADTAFLIAMGGATLLPSIRKDRHAMRFHIGFLALAVANYMLSDYSEAERAHPGFPSIH